MHRDLPSCLQQTERRENKFQNMNENQNGQLKFEQRMHHEYLIWPQQTKMKPGYENALEDWGNEGNEVTKSIACRRTTNKSSMITDIKWVWMKSGDHRAWRPMHKNVCTETRFSGIGVIFTVMNWFQNEPEYRKFVCIKETSKMKENENKNKKELRMAGEKKMSCLSTNSLLQSRR